MRSLHKDSALQGELSIPPVECLSACENPCAIALIAAAIPIYLFGNLPIEEEPLESTGMAVLAFANQYHAKADGSISYLKCPELLKKRVLAKIPPLPSRALDAGASG